MKIEELKPIFWLLGIGATVVIYAHSNFATSADLDKVEQRLENLADKDDVKALSSKIDTLTGYLLNKK